MRNALGFTLIMADHKRSLRTATKLNAMCVDGL